MITSAGRAINAYVKTGVETGVADADPHRLVLMLFEGALAAIAQARLKLSAGDVPGRGKADLEGDLDHSGRPSQQSRRTERAANSRSGWARSMNT